ncbi:MAG TPA: transposase family protein [Pseudonocardiaceae bacterium]|nr:transposase family protein [Pseudonocardiaceae bacterium]
MRYEAMTGLNHEQLTELVTRVHAVRGGGFSSRGRPYALGLFGSVALVVCVMRKNITQAFAAAIFGVSQSTVSRRWDLLRPLIGQVLAEFVPDLAKAVGAGTVLVDGTVCPTWDWRSVPDLYSTKAGYPGMNIQIAATVSGRLAAVGPIPVHGARHDAHAFTASGLAALLADTPTAADLGYVGVEGIEIVPFKRLPGGNLTTSQAEFNTALSKIRAAVEHAISHLKTWRMLSEEGGRYRAPIEKYQSMFKAVTGLYFFAACE